MLGASSALVQNAASSPRMPHVEGLQPLYDFGCTPRQGEVVMIAGRSGNMKSTFGLWLVENWKLPTLYLSADMSPFQASTKLAAHLSQKTVAEVEEDMRDPEMREYHMDRLNESKIRFSFKSPIKWDVVLAELNAWVTLFNEYPKVIVFDNLMDIENAESDYSEQMFAMQNISDLSRDTGATILVLHHASDKSWDAISHPYRPPSRNEVKGGLSEKPELSLSVAINNETNDFHVAVIKQRMGPQDATANKFATLRVNPETNTFWSPRATDYKIGDQS